MYSISGIWKKAKAGNDVYLSIDANLQKAAYDLLEEKLAGIILSNLTTSLTYDRTQAEEGSDVKIPIGDVYNAFISNEILNVGHFEAADAVIFLQKGGSACRCDGTAE